MTPRSSVDCLIAQTAIEHSLLLVDNDRDFELMAEVIPELRRTHTPGPTRAAVAP